jgi:FMNH2-dependent dimethyl sulfone monooxygenase
VSKPRPTIYAGGESEAAKTMIAAQCDAYVMHGDPVEAIAPKIADMTARRDRIGGTRMQYGMAAYAIVRDSEAEAKRELDRITALPPKPPKGFDNFEQWLSGTQLERELKLQEYSVSNRGLRPNLVGTPEQLQERIAEYEATGLDLLLLQMSPQAEEMDRFAEQVIAPMKAAA